MAFHDLRFNQNNPAEAMKRYVGDVYIHHNPAVADGKEAFIKYLYLKLTDLALILIFN